MRQLLVFCALCFVLVAGVDTYADIARPSPSPEQPKIILHTSMTIIPDQKAREARLQISQDSLNELKTAPEIETHLVNTVLTNGARYYVRRQFDDAAYRKQFNPNSHSWFVSVPFVLNGRHMANALGTTSWPKNGCVVAVWCSRGRRGSDDYAG